MELGIWDYIWWSFWLISIALLAWVNVHTEEKYLNKNSVKWGEDE